MLLVTHEMERPRRYAADRRNACWPAAGRRAPANWWPGTPTMATVRFSLAGRTALLAEMSGLEGVRQVRRSAGLVTVEGSRARSRMSAPSLCGTGRCQPTWTCTCPAWTTRC